MNIKKFLAPNIREAIQLVKREMGPEAVILQTRTAPASRSLQGSPARQIEVTAAIDYDTSLERKDCNQPRDLAYIIKRWQGLETELKELRQAVFHADAVTLLKPEIYLNPEWRTRYLNYKNLGLEPELIKDLMPNPENGPKEERSSANMLQNSLVRIMERIRIEQNTLGAGKARIYAFIGPTGVGKTTTLAKLAAVTALQQGKKTALITIDTFRIAAVSQLETYARIMGIPLSVAGDRNELYRAIQKHKDCDRILIDTAGRSPQKDQDIAELQKYFDIPEEVHPFLVLSATSGFGNLLQVERRFDRLPVKSCIFTKLDESEDISSVINFLLACRKPVAYLATGQQVPEDIEVATKKKLAMLLLRHLNTARSGGPLEVQKYGSGSRP